MRRGDPLVLELAAATVRRRWALFAGSFVALLLGTAILATSLTTLAATSGPGLGRARSVAQVTTALSVAVVAFVLVGTFAFVVDQRARELALLSLVGATPRRIRRLIRTETVVVAGAAALAGCVLGLPGAFLMRRWMTVHQIATSSYEVGFHPGALIGAFLIGVAAALAGTSAAAWRASRMRPLDSLREATASTRHMTAARWTLGTLVLAAGVVVGVAIAVVSPRNAALPGSFFEVPVLCAFGFALLAPALTRPVARIVTRPWLRFGAVPVVIRQGTLNGGRRVAALVSPVVMAVGMFTGMLGTGGTGSAATAGLLADSARADLVAVPASGTDLDDGAVAALRRTPGTRAAFVSAERVSLVADGGRVLDVVDARAVPVGALGDLLTPAVERGSLRGLSADAMVVTEDLANEYDLDVGQRLDARVGSGPLTTVKVAAVVDAVVDGGEAYLPDNLAGTSAPERALVRVDPGTSRSAVSASLRGHGVEVTPFSTFVSESSQDEADSTRLGNVVILGIAILYALVSIANTLVMNVSARRREVAALALAGATRRQVGSVLMGEALLTVVIGAVVGLASASVSLALQHLALTRVLDVVPLEVPWRPALVIVALCAATAATAVALASWATTRPTKELMDLD